MLKVRKCLNQQEDRQTDRQTQEQTTQRIDRKTLFESQTLILMHRFCYIAEALLLMLFKETLVPDVL